MYLAVDVGGTKTLLSSFEEQGGDPIKEIQFPTPDSYEIFLSELERHVTLLEVKTFSAAGIAMPGIIDRKKGLVIKYGNLSWTNTPVKADCEKMLSCPVYVENDAKLGGLSEAIIIKDDFKEVLYITLGTGIGISYITSGVIDTSFGDDGGLDIFVDHEGKSGVTWESIISGSAIKRRFGQRASDITDQETWITIAHDLSLGLSQLINDKHPEAVVVGGGAGKPFDRYGEFLKTELGKVLDPPVPAILPAAHPEEAVIYGCIDLIKQNNE